MFPDNGLGEHSHGGTHIEPKGIQNAFGLPFRVIINAKRNCCHCAYIVMQYIDSVKFWQMANVCIIPYSCHKIARLSAGFSYFILRTY